MPLPPPPKPVDVFDRDREWAHLAEFVCDDQPGATLGVVSGRRRQGKTYLLDAMCEATDGFYFGAAEALPAPVALRYFGETLAHYTGTRDVPHFEDWREPVDALLALATTQPKPVVLDEFPYLVENAPELPSVIQLALAPRRPQRLASRTRLLLCGSSISFMGNLISGTAPLYGRAGMNMLVSSFDFRIAAEYWGITDHRLAAMMYFVVGGTPAYRAEYMRGAVPASLDEFDPWVVEYVLNPYRPIFREVQILLAEDPDLRDRHLYHAVLAAVAEGNATRGGIANKIERKASEISHHLTVLAGADLLKPEFDAFRPKHCEYRITEPLVRFYHAIMLPHRELFERDIPGRAEALWAASRPRFLSNVAGPTFEYMCRRWAEGMAAPETFGGQVGEVRSGVVHDKHGKVGYEVDVVVFDSDGALLAVGEAKWGDVVGMGHLSRMEKVADVLAAQGPRPGVIALFSGTGFTPELTSAAAASGGHIQLVDLERLYTGS
jgi:AAA+ ATPase superfamily predicted ATPase